MVKTLNESLKVSDDFDGLFGEALADDAPVDDAVEDYLNENPAGLSFSYDNKEYVLAKDHTDGKVKLYQVVDGELIIKDPEVQINSKYTPDGTIEIGGLVSAGSRVYITRSAENPNEIIAFAAEDAKSISVDYENSVVIYSNSDKPSSEDQGNVSSPELPSNSDVNNSTLEGYIDLPYLDDGVYTSRGGFLFNSEGESLGKLHWLPEGEYKVSGGTLHREYVHNGEAIYLPMSSYGNFLETGHYLNKDGSVQGEVTIQLLADLGIPWYSMPITHDSEINFSAIEGPFSIELYQESGSLGLIVIGTGDNRAIVGSTNLPPGNYLVRVDEKTGEKTIHREYTKTEIIDGVTTSTTYFGPVA